MPSKSDKLAQRIQEVQKFVAGKIDQDATYSVVAQELEKIADSLKQGKLNVQIYSRFPILAQALQNCLSTRQTLAEFYQIKLGSFPSQVQPVATHSLAALILQSAGAVEQQQTRYPLPNNQNVLIGRRPDCQIVLPDQCNKVSGHHAEVQPLLGQTPPRWQICDRNSINGTYINGYRVQGCQTLQPGDRITLAYASPNEKTPEFFFEWESQSASKDDEFYKHLADCDVVCLVVNPSQLVSTDEKQFIEKAIKAQIAKLVVVVDTSSTLGQVNQIIKNNLAEVEAWVKSQNSGSPLKLAFLLLHPFYPNAQASAIDAKSLDDIDKFYQSLDALAKQGVEDILIKRVSLQRLSKITLIERTIASKEETLKREIRAEEEKLQSFEKGNLKEQAKKALKQASDERDKFFKQVKSELSQAKGRILDEFSKKSISYKIQQFIDNLTPVFVKKQGFTYIQLKPETSQEQDVSSTLSYLCRSELIQWSTEEWKRVCTDYADDGLSGLIKRIRETLCFIPSLSPPDSLLQPIQNIDVQKSFEVSLVESSAEIRYKETSLGGHLFKNVKSQVALILTTLTFFANVFISQDPNIKQQWKQWLGLITVLLLPFVVVWLIYDYQKNKEAKLEETGEKLKKEVCSHYQSIAKSFVERIVQSFGMRLEAEDQRLKGIIETVGEQFVAHITEIDKNQVLVKANLEKLKLQQKSLEKEKADVQKLKQS